MAEDAQTAEVKTEMEPAPPAPQTMQTMGLEERVAILEEEIRTLKTSFYAIPGALEKEKLEIKKNLEAFEGIQTSFQEVADSAAKNSRTVNSLEKRVDGVKRNATSGVVASILVFSILLIISLFIRAH